ncbi:hypothetical protein C8F04DRAFT_1265293 [Mycena alexandri]|uniref:CxC2-like cysteine cluster KDZ transposase-associated domain-containing protein n=1 Tax=Mycena alexandri TaxID=1745969 RepID=A0AAD6SJA8_9AGAR|nr:hypothetical protein C8F04DRAFT_1265293 [Mycena alexandri]
MASNNEGPNLENHEVLEMYLGIEAILNQCAWQVGRSSVCPCGKPSLVHCNDCRGPDLCQKWILNAHPDKPFHDVQAWSVALNYYTHTTFYHLGLRIKLGHSSDVCPAPRLGRREAITPKAIKTVAVEFCACPNGASEDDQIKAHGWWPCTRILFVHCPS